MISSAANSTSVTTNPVMHTSMKTGKLQISVPRIHKILAACMQSRLPLSPITTRSVIRAATISNMHVPNYFLCTQRLLQGLLPCLMLVLLVQPVPLKRPSPDPRRLVCRETEIAPAHPSLVAELPGRQTGHQAPAICFVQNARS